MATAVGMRFVRHRIRTRSRSGQVLVEFAVVAFVFTLLLGAMLALGYLFFSANTLQQAADVGAMELARHAEAPTADFQTALINSGLYSEADLVVPVGTDVATLPLINQLLFSVYIYDPDLVDPNSGAAGMLRYPGTVVTNSGGDQTVVIPIVGFGNRNAASGVETITEWRRVVEEILPVGATQGPYSLNSPTPGSLDPGMVAMRINYPYQSSALIAYVHTDSDGNLLRPADSIGRAGVLNVPVTADDSAVTGAATATFPNGQTLAGAGYTLVNPSANPHIGATPHRGTYGFGEAQAFAMTVRPYRKVLAAQAIYRREVFQ